MSLFGDALTGMRMAGTQLAEYLTTPQNLSNLAKEAATKTAVQTTVSQAIPRMLGLEAPDLASSVIEGGASNFLGGAIGGGLHSMGVPKLPAQVAGDILGTVGTVMASRNIRPEVTEQQQHFADDQEAMPPEMSQYMQLQRFQADLDNERYNNAIRLAVAKNYHEPTRIIHSNPSADAQTAYNILNPNMRYGR